MMMASESAAPWEARHAVVRQETRVRSWGLQVRFLLRKLLSLGASYEVRARVASGTEPLSLEALGFGATDMMKAKLLRVVNVVAPQAAQSFHTLASNSAIKAIEPDDYVVGLNDDDFLLTPVNLSDFRRMVHRPARQPPQSAQEQQKLQEIAIRFVRLKNRVDVDPYRGRCHGEILTIMESIAEKQTDLNEKLVVMQRELSQHLMKEINRERDLLKFIRIRAHEIREEIMSDLMFTQTAKVQKFVHYMKYEWVAPSKRPQNETSAAEISSGDHGAVDSPQRVHRSPDKASPLVKRPSPAARPTQPQAPAASPAIAASPTTTTQQLSAADYVDIGWLDKFSSSDLKWLGAKPEDRLRATVKLLLGAFLDNQDDLDATIGVTQQISEELLRMYIRKRVRVADQKVVFKEFTQHVRMLHNNLRNAENKQLRVDLLTGALPVPRLCDMSSEELAPEALQRERQRRFEQHAKSSTIQAPTGVTLVKTKHGFREVLLGDAGAGVVLAAPEGSPNPPSAPASPEEEHAMDISDEDPAGDLFGETPQADDADALEAKGSPPKASASPQVTRLAPSATAAAAAAATRAPAAQSVSAQQPAQAPVLPPGQSGAANQPAASVQRFAAPHIPFQPIFQQAPAPLQPPLPPGPPPPLAQATAAIPPRDVAGAEEMTAQFQRVEIDKQQQRAGKKLKKRVSFAAGVAGDAPDDDKAAAAAAAPTPEPAAEPKPVVPDRGFRPVSVQDGRHFVASLFDARYDLAEALNKLGGEVGRQEAVLSEDGTEMAPGVLVSGPILDVVARFLTLVMCVCVCLAALPRVCA